MPTPHRPARGSRRDRHRWARAIAAVVAAWAVAAAGCTPQRPERPPPAGQDGVRWVVTLGDSYISGEGARWAGTTLGNARRVDALGPDAYFDQRGTESAPGCHRAEQSVATVGAGLRGRNLACSGARTRSDASGVRLRPGLDFAEDDRGTGQALALQRFATRHRVSAVAVSIGGNDFGFGTLVGACLSPVVVASATDPQCRDDPGVTALFEPGRRQAVREAVTAALGRVSEAMARAGYDAADYRLLVLTYPSPVPPARRLRTSSTDIGRTGCLVSGPDATWLNRTALRAINGTVRAAAEAAELANLSVLELGALFVGHRLCERGTGPLEATGLRSWRSPGAAERLEWVNPLYLSIAPWQLQESLHPNYWGMLAQQACLREALLKPPAAVRRCVTTGGGSGTEPGVRLVP